MTKKTQLMGILNATPDSFYDGGKYFERMAALQRGFEMIEEGADLIDIGGESSRPGSIAVPLEKEIERVLPLVEALAPRIPVSIDTSKAEVAKQAVEKGASFLNDITALSNPEMIALAALNGVDVCLMHMQGTPATMQHSPHYPQGVLVEVVEFFKKRVDAVLKGGVLPSKIYLDPGIGFGKSPEDNWTLLRHLPELQKLGFPLLLGISRKSFLSKLLKKPANELLSTTVAINTMALLEGVSIIRVHDVKEHRDIIDVIHCLKK